MKGKKRLLSLLLCGVMLLSLVPLAAFAVPAGDAALETGLCPHHTVHDADCGYAQAQPGSPCTHEHTQDCYTTITQCTHIHDETCGYTEADPAACTHQCTEASGCVTQALLCPHVHDDACGYAPRCGGRPLRLHLRGQPAPRPAWVLRPVGRNKIV